MPKPRKPLTCSSEGAESADGATLSQNQRSGRVRNHEMAVGFGKGGSFEEKAVPIFLFSGFLGFMGEDEVSELLDLVSGKERIGSTWPPNTVLNYRNCHCPDSSLGMGKSCPVTSAYKKFVCISHLYLSLLLSSQI